MEDLANERDAVVRRLVEFNFTPSNAEGWVPAGSGTWDRIFAEIAACDIFVLISGARYGFIPTEGLYSSEGLSVTHLEYREALRLKKPILPFFKGPNERQRPRDREGQKRFDFQQQVGSLEQDGITVAWFNLASDLAQKVGQAVVETITEGYRGARSVEAEAAPAAPAAAAAWRGGVPPFDGEFPPALLTALKAGDATLFAGSGFSLAAGMPSSAAFSERMAQLVRKLDPDYVPNVLGRSIAGVATDLEHALGRGEVIRAVRDLIPAAAEPTVAHLAAVRLFPNIITTNYDGLFRKACSHQGLTKVSIAAEPADGVVPSNSILELHGACSDENSLVLNERDFVMLDESRPALWAHARELLRNTTLVVAGCSIRDPDLLRLFTEAKREKPGYFVANRIWQFTPARVSPWELKCIEADVNTFFTALDDCVKAGH